MKKSTLMVLAVLVAGPAMGQAAESVFSYSDLAARLYDLEGLAAPPLAGERSGNFSSWDRGAKYNAQMGQYEGWHANADGGGFIRREEGGIVAAELDGPGVLWRVWSALAQEGHIKIFMDGQGTPALDIPFSEFFNNQSGLFAYPELVLTLSRGRNNFMPIPFQQSCKIVLEKDWGAYYQITYTQFPAGTTVPSFRGEFNAVEQRADYYVQPIRILPVPADGIYEGEHHLGFDPPARVQEMTHFGGGWKGGQQLLWHGIAGEELSVTFEVPRPYSGPMTAQFTSAPDYGIFDVLLNGKVLRQGIDLYDPQVTPAPIQKLGTVELPPGAHTLTFRLTGGNEQAKHFQGKFFMWGLDYLALAPLDPPADVEPASVMDL